MGIILYLATAIIVNVFLGAWRVNTKKFSWQWFFAIHASIPFIIIIRIFFGLPLLIIPFGIAASLVGQFSGSAIYEKIISKSTPAT